MLLLCKYIISYGKYMFSFSSKILATFMFISLALLLFLKQYTRSFLKYSKTLISIEVETIEDSLSSCKAVSPLAFPLLCTHE